MNPESVDANLVSQIVAEVLRRLPNEASALPTNKESRQQESSELKITKKLLTQEDIEQLPPTVDSICLLRGCVITPSAKDAIRQRGLMVTYQVSRLGESSQPLVLGYLKKPAPSDQVLQGLPLRVEVLIGDCPIAVTRQLVARVQQRQFAVFLTKEVMPAICLANRTAAVRAATVQSMQELDRLLLSMAPNLLVVSDTPWSGFALRQLITRFAERATWDCASAWDKYLKEEQR